MPVYGQPASTGGNTNVNKTMDGGGGGSANPAAGGVDPFTRKSSVKKLTKQPKKQQGSSRFRTAPKVELQHLSLLKGMYDTFIHTFIYTSIIFKQNMTTAHFPMHRIGKEFLEMFFRLCNFSMRSTLRSSRKKKLRSSFSSYLQFFWSQISFFYKTQQMLFNKTGMSCLSRNSNSVVMFLTLWIRSVTLEGKKSKELH